MKNKFDVTFEEVASMENLCEAWQEFIRGKRKKKDVQEFALRLGDEISELHSDLMGGIYRHGEYQHFKVNDPKPREIHKATVCDRLLHHALHRKLYPHFARCFIADSFSCQIGKGVHRALDRFRSMVRKVSKNHTRTCWVLKCDIRKFFASIDHGILLDILRERITDSRIRAVLENVVTSFSVSSGYSGKGIPLGNLTSQLFANVYMDEFDQFVKQSLRFKNYIRYADDFVFLSSDRVELVGCLPKIEAFLFERLALHLHPNKVSITTVASGIDFLGWVHFPHHRVPRGKTRKRMLKRTRENPTNETLQSYLGLIQHGDAFELGERLLNEKWLFRVKME